MSLHHALDVEPVSEKALYVHESDLADPSQADVPVPSTAQGKPLDRRERLQLELRSQPEDNVRVYIPLDINENAILRRLHHIFWKYGDVSEANEAPFRSEVETLVSQVEIYDQVWFVRDGDSGNHHSGKATALVQEMCSWLMEHPGCGETFPMDLVEELRREYQLCFDE